MQLEPDAVVAVDAWRRDVAAIAPGGLRGRLPEALAVAREPGQLDDEGHQPGIGVEVKRGQARVLLSRVTLRSTGT